MSPKAVARRVLLVADFNVANLHALLANEPDSAIVPISTPFGSLYQTLLAPPEAEAVFVWTRPETACPSFGALVAGQRVPLETVLDEVDAYLEAVLTAKATLPVVLVASWTTPWYQRGLGMLDLKSEAGVARVLLAMNSRLVDRLAPLKDVYVLDASRWSRAAGPRGDSPSSWYAAKMPYTPDALRIAAADLRAAVRGIAGDARKVLVLDLDDTLWGGIVGDAGWENLLLGGHNAKGEAHQDFQRALKALLRRGVVLALASKNDEGVALEAIRQHPEMVLREGDFAAWRINWQDKASNIVAIAEELNVGLQHVVFIDDNPAERGRVRETLPDVLVPEWPVDPRGYVAALSTLDCFDAPAITDEDRTRGAMYVAERERQSIRRSVQSVDEWLAALSLVVRVEPLRAATLPRAAQLLNKTNQMNLSSRRLTESELGAWAAVPGNALWTVTVSDRFGDAGLTGLVSVTVRDSTATLVDFVLSCRVFGRQVEEAMLHVAVAHAAESGAMSLSATLVPTAKNKPTVEFLRDRSRFSVGGSGVYEWGCGRPYPLVSHITLDLSRAVHA